MDKQSLAHTKWECKYHLVFAPKYRRQIIYGQLNRDEVGWTKYEIVGLLFHSLRLRIYLVSRKTLSEPISPENKSRNTIIVNLAVPG